MIIESVELLSVRKERENLVVSVMELNPTDVMIGKKLKACRLEAGLKQQELGKEVGLKGMSSQVTVSNWERGIKRPNLGHIEAYATRFKKELDWFFTSDDSPAGRKRSSSYEIKDSVDILKSLLGQIVLITNQMADSPKTTVAKREITRLLEDLDVY
jgi:transcriptional regulator with XRE-family HTH domain